MPAAVVCHIAIALTSFSILSSLTIEVVQNVALPLLLLLSYYSSLLQSSPVTHVLAAVAAVMACLALSSGFFSSVVPAL